MRITHELNPFGRPIFQFHIVALEISKNTLHRNMHAQSLTIFRCDDNIIASKFMHIHLRIQTRNSQKFSIIE